MSQAGGKKVEVVPLAQKKMALRKIPESWVKETVADPEQVVDGYGGRRVAHRRVAMGGADRLLRVVYEETENALIVVTAYLTSDIARYWRETP